MPSRSRQLFLASIVGVLALAGLARSEEPAPAEKPQPSITPREYFQAAGRWYRLDCNRGFSSGSYRSIVESFSDIDSKRESEFEAYRPLYPTPFDATLTVDEVAALLDDEAADVRFAAALWLFEEHELWWISQLDQPLRRQMEEGLVAKLSKQLGSEDATHRDRAAKALVELQTPAALGVLIRALEEPENPHKANLAKTIVEAIQDWDNRQQFFSHSSFPRSALDDLQTWRSTPASARSTPLVLSCLKRLAGPTGPVPPAGGSPSVGPIAAEHAASEWSRLPMEEKSRRLAEWGEQLGFYSEESVTAATELGKISDPRAVKLLETALRHSVKEVRAAAATSLGGLKGRRAFDALLFAARDGSWNVRAAAVEALGKIGDRRAIAALQTLEADASSEVRLAALRVLGKLGDKTIVDRLLAALHDEATAVRLYAVQALADVTSQPVTEGLMRAAKDADKEVRMSALSLLAQRDDPRIVDVMRQAMIDNDVDTRLVALEWLAGSGDARLLKPLLVMATDSTGAGDATIQLRALAAIKRLRHDEIRKPLLEALAGEDVTAKARAVLALGSLRETEAVESLIGLLDNDDPVFRQYVILALMRSGDRRSVKPLTTELGRKYSLTRVDAALALGHLGDARGIGPLTELLDDTDPLIRRAGVTALGMLADERAVAPLKPALKDKDEVVVMAAEEALAFTEKSPARITLELRFAALPLRPDYYGYGNVRTPGVLKLFAQGWRPKTLEDCVRLLILYGKSELLEALAPQSTPALVKQLESKDDATREAAAEVLIRIGDEKTIPALTTAMTSRGTQEMANMFDNCGRRELGAAAEQWIMATGGSRVRYLGGAPTQWGGGDREEPPDSGARRGGFRGFEAGSSRGFRGTNP